MCLILMAMLIIFVINFSGLINNILFKTGVLNMSYRPNEFDEITKHKALLRQGNRCASCGTSIFYLGNKGRSTHYYGESAQAHHIRPIKSGGTSSENNCVIICESCHYSVHEGGNYRHGTVVGSSRMFPHFKRKRKT